MSNLSIRDAPLELGKLPRELIAHLGRGGHFQYFWRHDDKHTLWFPVDKPAPIPPGENLYWGVHPVHQAKGQYERATIPDVAAINCLFGEFDAKDFGGDKDAVRAHVEGLRLPPSALVDSGGGWQAYWLLAEPIVLEDETRPRVITLQARWVAYVGGDPASKDLARVLRVPGTFNHKYDPPRPVELVYLDEPYTLDLLAQHLETFAPVEAKPVLPTPTPSNGRGVIPVYTGTDRARAYGLAAMQAELAEFAAAGNGTRNNVLNQAAFALGTLVGGGMLAESEVETALYNIAISKRDASFTEREIRATIASGLEAGKREPRPLPPDTRPTGAIVAEAEQHGNETLADAAGQVYAAQAKTLADALAPRPKLPSVVSGILPPRSLSIWYGSPGNLKSNLLFDLCLAVSTGAAWLPDLPGPGNGAGYPVTQCPALWIDIDNGEDVVAERLAAFARARNAPADAPIYWLSFPTPPLVASKGLPGLTAYAKSIGAGLIVVDNLLRVSGVRDENASEIDAAMANLRKLAEATGAAVEVIHHRRKDTLGREGDSLRGHSSIEGAIDAAFLVKREDGADEITVKCTKARRKPIETFGALWTYELAADGEILHTARFWRSQLKDPEAEKESELRRKILTAIGEAELSKSSIRDLTGGRRDLVYALLEKMTAERGLERRKGEHNSLLYRVKSG